MKTQHTKGKWKVESKRIPNEHGAIELLEYAKASLLFENIGSFEYNGKQISGKEAELRLEIMRSEAIKKATE